MTAEELWEKNRTNVRNSNGNQYFIIVMAGQNRYVIIVMERDSEATS